MEKRAGIKFVFVQFHFGMKKFGVRMKPRRSPKLNHSDVAPPACSPFERGPAAPFKFSSPTSKANRSCAEACKTTGHFCFSPPWRQLGATPYIFLNSREK